MERHLSFRDYLREQPDICKEIRRMKEEASEQRADSSRDDSPFVMSYFNLFTM
ncbi:GrpB family protein [Brevibacillus sp. DP1.3A]|uniref:GrpB family protein n=1 Tax=Brevibacillus sp. DP1.3A TaxID=2738867 RepID=UPI00156B3D01|nr:GrpB family protein [Brevibacillus sp. DP1.3A]